MSEVSKSGDVSMIGWVDDWLVNDWLDEWLDDW